MTTPKTGAHSERSACNSAGSSVYELAIVAAKEAKRINEKFYAAKKMPPNNLVHTALKRVIGGQVAYRLGEDVSGNVKADSGNGGGETEE
jgi:DNA-directed RNA polymerase subunit K/omega